MAGGRPVGRSVGRPAGWFSNILKNSKSRFVDYITVVCNDSTPLGYLGYCTGIKCVITKVKYIVELKDRVLVPWGPLSISAMAELVFFKNPLKLGKISLFLLNKVGKSWT